MGIKSIPLKLSRGLTEMLSLETYTCSKDYQEPLKTATFVCKKWSTLDNFICLKLLRIPTTQYPLLIVNHSTPFHSPYPITAVPTHHTFWWELGKCNMVEWRNLASSHLIPIGQLTPSLPLMSLF